MTRLSPLAWALLAVVGAGCKCGKTPSTTPTVALIEPTAGQVITAADDVDATRAGIQINVRARTTDVADGSSASLVVNRDNNTAREVFTQGDQIEFAEVTLIPADAEGTVTLTVAVRDRDTGRVPRDEITVTLEETGTLDCGFLDPVDGATLGESDDADPATRGFQYDVVVQCTTDLTGVAATLAVDGRLVPSSVFAGQVVTFPSVTFGEGDNTLEATVATGAGTWTGTVGIVVDTPECEVRLDPSGDVVLNLDGGTPRLGLAALADANADPSDGIQAALTASTPDCQGGDAVLVVDDIDTVTVAVDSISVDFGAVTFEDGSHRVRVEVRSALPDGPTGLDPDRTFYVDGLRPSPVVFFPTEGQVLTSLDDQDGDPTNGIQTEFIVEAVGLEAGGTVAAPELSALIELELVNTDSGASVIATCVVGVDGCEDPVDPARYRFPVDLDTVASWTVTATVTDPAGNAGVDGPVGFTTSDAGATIAITDPTFGSTVTAANGTEVVITVSSPGQSAGSVVTVVCQNVGSATGTLDASGQAQVNLDFAAAPCDGLDTSCTASIDVDGTTVVSAPVSFRADVEAPTVTITEPLDGATLFSTDVVVGVVTSCVENGQTATVTSNTGVTGTVPITGDAGLFTMTLGSGQHVLTASVADAAGNTGQSPTVTITVDADPPNVVFVRPSDGLLLGPGDNEGPGPEFVYDVQVQVANKPAGTLVELFVGYDDGAGGTVWRAPLGPVPTGAVTLRAVFTAVAFPEGSFRLRAVATGPSGLKGERIISSQVSTGRASCNIVSPIDGASLGAAADANGDPTDGIQHDVRVLTDAPDTAEVELTLVDGTGATTPVVGSPTSGEVLFTGVTFTTDGTGPHGQNELTAVCDRGAAVPGAALPNTVRVDLEAPTGAIARPTDGQVFNAASVDVSAQPGFQIDFTGTAADASNGQSVNAGASGLLNVACSDGSDVDIPLTFTTGATGVEARARPSLPDEATCTLTFTATDLAGNVSAPVSVSITVDRIPPTIGITSPVDGSRFNAAQDTSGNPGFQRNVVTTFSGATTIEIRITNNFGDDGTTGWVERLATSANPAPTATSRTFNNVTLTLGDDDVVTVIARASDAAGNVVDDLSTVVVDLVAPLVTITRPDPGTLPPCFIVRDDSDRSTPGLQIQVDVNTTGVEEGLPLRLCTTVDPGSGLGTCVQNPASFLVDQSTVAGNRGVFLPATFSDGTQSIYAEVEDLAGNFNSSTPFSICVDTTPPDVLTFAVDSDTTAPFGAVSAAEYTAAGNQVCFSVGVTGADNRTLTVRTNNPAADTVVGTGTVTAGVATVCGTLAEGGHTITARVLDVNGNPNRNPAAPLIVDPESSLTLLVDRTAPAITVTDPATANLNYALDPDQGTSDFDLTFSVSSDAGDGQVVTFLVDTATVGTEPLAGGAATLATAVPLAQGAHTLEAQVVDLAGNPGSTTFAVNVDTIRPVVVINSPTTGSSFTTSSVDFEVDVSGAAAGNTLRLVDQISGGTLISTTVAAVQPQTISLTLSDATYDVVAEAVDAAQNVGQSAVVSITVDTVGCAIGWTDPTSAAVTFNAADDESGAAGLPTTITAQTTDCAGLDVSLFVGGTLVGTQTTDGTGFASFVLDLADGSSNVDVRVDIDDGVGNVTSDSFVASVDVTPPGLTRDSPTGTAFTYVAAGNKHLATGTFGGTVVIQDLIAGGNLNASYSFTVTGAVGGTFTFKLGVTDVVPARTITTDPESFTFSATIAQSTIGTLTARVTDPAANATSDSFPITVDVQAPAAPSLGVVLANERSAELTASWQDTGDDGSTGTASAYALRWDNTDIVDEPTWDAASTMAVAFSPSAPGTAQTSPMTPLPPLNDYFVVLRVEDEVGNRSPLPALSSTASNYWTATALLGEGAGFFGWQVTGIGDVNNDGAPDFVVTAPTLAVAGRANNGAAYVYYGGMAYTAMSANRQRLDASTAGTLFGFHASAGDVDGDGIPDLLLGGYGFSGSRGLARIYFGQDRSTASCAVDFTNCWLDSVDYVELRGIAATNFEFGRAVSIVGDYSGDGRAEVLVAARRAQSAQGRAYVFEGRTKAQWQAAATANDGDGVFYIPATSADVTITGVAIDDQFGERWGYTSLGDLDGDAAAEFTAPASNVGRFYVYNGGTVSTRTGDIVANTDNVGGSPLTGIPASGGNDGFGVRAVAGFVRGTATRDLAVAAGGANDLGRVRFYQTSATGIGANFVTLRPDTGDVATNFGFDIALGDLNLDGRPDIAVGTNGTSAKRAFAFYNTGSGAFFRTTPDSRLLSADNGYGVAVDIGDYDQDTEPDLLIAAPFASGGRVTVYH